MFEAPAPLPKNSTGRLTGRLYEWEARTLGPGIRQVSKSQEITWLSLSPNATPAELSAASYINDLELQERAEKNISLIARVIAIEYSSSSLSKPN